MTENKEGNKFSGAPCKNGAFFLMLFSTYLWLFVFVGTFRALGLVWKLTDDIHELVREMAGYVLPMMKNNFVEHVQQPENCRKPFCTRTDFCLLPRGVLDAADRAARTHRDLLWLSKCLHPRHLE